MKGSRNRAKGSARIDMDETLPTGPVGLAANLPCIVYRLLLRENRRMHFFNEMLFQITGFHPAELLAGKVLSIDSLIHPEDLPLVVRRVESAIAEERSFEVEYRIRCKNGTEKFLLERGQPVVGKDGAPFCIDGVIFDVSETKKLEAMWKRYEFIVNTSKEFMTLVRRGFVYEACNEAYCRAHKKSREEIIGHTVADVWGTKGFESIRDRFEKCFSGEEVHYQLSFPFSSLGTRFFDVAYYPYFGIPGVVTHVVVISRDMSERYQIELERNRLATAIQQSGEGVVITDPDGIIQYANPALELMTGYSPAEVMGKTPALFKSGVHDQDFYRNLKETLVRGEVWRGHFVNRRKNGSLYEENTTISPVRDEQGCLIHYVAVKQDVTRQVELEKQLRQSQKLEAIGTLAGGIAHDFNNILAAIMGYADLARVEVPIGSPAIESLEEILTASRRAQQLISQILVFSRRAERSLKPVLLHQVVQEGLNLVRVTIPKTVEIRLEIDESVHPILADATQLHQILFNLCSNGVQAIASGQGKLTIGVHEVAEPLFPEGSDPVMQAGQYLCLSVKDSGVGMDKATMDRIFEPYFTTKPVGKGTGLGLAVVHGIVKEHGGCIRVQSEIGVGSLFQVYFPVSSRNQDVASSLVPVSGRGIGRIMLVDDESVLVDFGVKALSFLGFEVRGFSKSEEALKTFAADPRAFDAVITDYAMPGLSGIELTRKMKALRPEIPVIMYSGYGSGQIPQEEIQTAGVSQVLRKPLTINELGMALQRVLPSRRGE